ncbi:hypothetical protein BgiMline_036751, partial [Biomphalaria glabrata]
MIGPVIYLEQSNYRSYWNRSNSGAYRWSNRQEVAISRTVKSSCRAQSIFGIQHTVEWNNYLQSNYRSYMSTSCCFFPLREMKPSSNRDMQNIKITARNFYSI